MPDCTRGPSGRLWIRALTTHTALSLNLALNRLARRLLQPPTLTEPASAHILGAWTIGNASRSSSTSWAASRASAGSGSPSTTSSTTWRRECPRRRSSVTSGSHAGGHPGVSGVRSRARAPPGGAPARVRFLLDQNLSPRLVSALADVFPGSIHVRRRPVPGHRRGRVELRGSARPRHRVQGRGVPPAKLPAWPASEGGLDPTGELLDEGHRNVTAPPAPGAAGLRQGSRPVELPRALLRSRGQAERIDGMKRLTPTRRGGIQCPTERTRAHGRTRRGPAMDYVGIDLHKKESQICILSEGGELSECRIRTEPQRFAEVLGGRPRARILLEASTESEWVARCLEGLGHEVVVADPNFAPMYATRTRKVKTDRRDARALAGGLSAGRVPPRPSAVGRAAACAGPPGGARCLGPDADRVHRPDPRSVAPARLAGADGERGDLQPAGDGAARCRAACSRRWHPCWR